MRRYMFFALSAMLPAVAAAKPAPAFYVCAHPDDCLLFMSPNLYDDTANSEQKVVVVYLTSGDAGQAFGKKPAAPGYPYVRERASLEASKWMADIDKEAIRTQQHKTTVTIHGHPIDRISYANTVSYFLRLPDGNFDGNGFQRYGYQSLRKLKSGEIQGITPIDGREAYRSWQDLTGVVSGIVDREAAGETNITLHISEPDTGKNTNDHSDHTTGASGIMEMLTQRTQNGQNATTCYQIYKHIDYAIAEKPVNLDGDALQNKSGGFAVLTAAQRHFLDFHNWDKAHRPYLTRNYYTTATLPQGCEHTP